MRKIQILGLAALAVFAFSTVVASSASAAAWLVAKVEIAKETASETEGELELKVYENSTGSTVLEAVLCSGIFDGFLVPPNLALIVDLLSLTQVEIGSLESGDVEGTALSCTVIHDAGALTDCKENTTALLGPDNLNLALGTTWEVTFEEMAGGVLLGIFPANAGYHVECESLIGIVGTNLCTGAGGITSITWSNVTSTTPPSVLGTFGAVSAAERGECEMGGAHVGEVIGSGSTWAIGAELEHLETALD
jgi:hypothetical protein